MRGIRCGRTHHWGAPGCPRRAQSSRRDSRKLHRMTTPHLVPRLAAVSLLTLSLTAFAPGALSFASATSSDIAPKGADQAAARPDAGRPIENRDDWFLDLGEAGTDGTQATVAAQPATSTGKRIVVSLGNQTLSAYDGGS